MHAASCAISEPLTVLVGLVYLADFIVAVGEFRVEEIRRRPFVNGDLEHLSGFAKPSLVTKNVAEVLRNATLAPRYRETLFEDLDSNSGSSSGIENLVEAEAVNWHGADDLAIEFVMITDIDTVAAKEVRIVADSLGETHVDVAVLQNSVGQDVLRFDDEEVVQFRLGEDFGIDRLDVPIALLVDAGVQDRENADCWKSGECVCQSHNYDLGVIAVSTIIESA
jgi:hypothetical protein